MHDTSVTLLKRAFVAAGLSAVALAVVLPIWKYGSPSGHDSQYHLLWADQFIESLSSGVLYPRWLPSSNSGLGSPTFIFYSPLPYYVAALLWPLTGSVSRALDLATTAALLASGVVAYRYLRNGVSRGPAFMGAFAIMALPYRVTDLYLRSAYPEFMGFVWPPLVFMAFRAIACASTPHAARLAAAGLAVATAGLAVTHLVSLMIWGPVFALMGIMCGRKGQRIATLRLTWGGLAAGLGLSAVYLLPAYLERSFVQIEKLYRHRAEDNTLFSTPLNASSFNGTISLIACWEVALIAAAAAAVLLRGAGRPWRTVVRTPLQKVAIDRLPVLGAVILGVCGFTLMLPWSAPLWRHLPLFSTIQFPWRLLVIVTPTAALLVACATERLVTARAPVISRGLAAVALLLFGANLIVSRLAIHQSTLDPVEATRLTAGWQWPDAPEYRPKHAFPQLNRDEPIPHMPQATILVPGGTVDVTTWDPTRRVLAIRAPDTGSLQIGTFFYPGWRATVDGKTAPILIGEHGIISLNIPAGQYLVELQFASTGVRHAGLILSLTTAVALAVSVIHTRRSYRDSRKASESKGGKRLEE
jgi:hypothetical protein